MVCTPEYGHRANTGEKWSGIEAAMIVSEIAKGANDKFIAILRQGNEDTAIPYFMQGRLWIDARNDDFDGEWHKLCTHMETEGELGEAGTLIFEALFAYDDSRIYEQPRLQELKRFTEFAETGQTEEGRWYVRRRDPIRNDFALILFQDPE